MDLGHLWQVILLGIIEGLTEFLPVSSTGHLILAGHLIGFHGPAESSFKIAIQLGAILAVCLVYWRKLWGVASTVLVSRDAQLFTRNVLLAVTPAMAIGVVAYDGIKAMLERPDIVAWALLIGGVAILLIERRAIRLTRFTSVEQFPLWLALAIGFVQCLAMIPGVSRSGATILGALLMGVERKTAAEFTFFLAIPTMAAATSYDLYKNWQNLNADDALGIGIGFITAFFCAWIVVRSFVAIVGRFGFAPFAWYRIIIGTAALVWLNFG
jgi:undecaprenyl-diphosphatase